MHFCLIFSEFGSRVLLLDSFRPVLSTLAGILKTRQLPILVVTDGTKKLSSVHSLILAFVRRTAVLVY
jgi:hypothetical protein